MIRQLAFLAFEIAIPAFAIICGITLSMNGRKLLGWLTALAVLGIWAAGLTLVASRALAGSELFWWIWAVALGVPGLGAIWLGLVTRQSIASRAPGHG